MNNKIIVISDLHVGAGLTDDCDSDLEEGLTSFLERLCASDEAVELVINGDFLDFAQAPPFQAKDLRGVSEEGITLCFTEEQSLAKLEAITKAHDSIFKALAAFIESNSDNRIVVLPGNHDADFFWPKVQSQFKSKICHKNDTSGQRLIFNLEQVYRPAHSRVWIEHGHQYDPLNSFYVEKKPYWSKDNPPIVKDTKGLDRLIECVGTRFMIKFMNGLDVNYPFVDNVKPFSRFLTIFGASAFVRGFGPIKAAVSIWAMLKYLVATVTHHRSDLLGLDQSSSENGSILLEFVKEMALDDQNKLGEALRARGYKELDRQLLLYLQYEENADRLMMFLSENLDLLEGIEAQNESFLGVEEGTLQLVKGFSINETEELIKAANKILAEHPLDLVVMGHTHERVENPNYINPGSWTRYYQFADDEKLKSWSLLKKQSYEYFPYQLNYVEIASGKPETTRLSTYRERRL